jgi:hypothetical protein
MRQEATQYIRGGTKSEETNTNQNASKRLLTASFQKRRTHMYACVIASLQAHASGSNATQKRGNKQRKENAIQNAVKRLLTASFDKTQQTQACVLLSAPHSRSP